MTNPKTDFDLDHFLRNYRPAHLDLRCYLRLDALKNYYWLRTSKDKKNLDPLRTYIRYIKTGDEFKYRRCSEEEIQDGGLLLAGGVYLNGEFVETQDKSKWTHLKLDTNIPKKEGKKKRYYSYYIKIYNYHIFYTYTRGKDLVDVILDGLKKIE